MEREPFIQFDFNNDQLIFKNPIEIVSTSSINQVEKVINQVEKAVNKGFYAAGFISYEAYQAFYDGQFTKRPNDIPLIWFGLFDKKINHKNKRRGPYKVSEWHLNIDEETYKQQFNTIQKAIKNGKLEQVNFTTNYEAVFSGNSYRYYDTLKNNQKGDYCAFIQTNTFDLLSISPELFFELNNHTITMKPMKGTIERGRSFQEDEKKKKKLAHSYKNKYENELAIQVVCNELKSIAEEKTISIISKFDIEQYPTLYQMTSTIQATINNEKKLYDLLKVIFPAASITGRPKRKAIEMIDQLEQEPRGVYCGAIGYLTPDKDAVFNVPIRTVTIDKRTKKATYGVGGAITKRSTAKEELTEIKTKGKILYESFPSFHLLETIGLVNGDFIVYNEHIKRLKESAQYFNFDIKLQNIEQKLSSLKNQYKEGYYRLRLLVDKTGDFTIDIKPFQPIDQTVYVKLAEKPIDSNNIFLYHKTTNRDLYKQLKVEDRNVFDTLLWNERKEVTEFTIGNIVVQMEGKRYTPPVSSGLLQGTFREKLLKEKKIKERIIHIEDLKHCEQLWLINSVRRWINVQLT